MQARLLAAACNSSYQPAGKIVWQQLATAVSRLTPGLSALTSKLQQLTTLSQGQHQQLEAALKHHHSWKQQSAA
jgi:hypothetical protein